MVNRFGTIREAKDFLASRIAAEARRENAPLSEIERKMLYFTETGWTLPDMAAVSAEFDRDYDEDEYERKIARLVHAIEARNHAEDRNEEEAWDDAILKLSEEDHYLSILVDLKCPEQVKGSGFLPTLDSPEVRLPHDTFKLWLTAFSIVFVVIALFGIYDWLFGPRP